jgi:hypothetical protein
MGIHAQLKCTSPNICLDSLCFAHGCQRFEVAALKPVVRPLSAEVIRAIENLPEASLAALSRALASEC